MGRYGVGGYSMGGYSVGGYREPTTDFGYSPTGASGPAYPLFRPMIHLVDSFLGQNYTVQTSK